MKRKFKLILWMAPLLLACKNEEDAAPRQVEYVYEFEQHKEGWEGGFSDLPEEGHDIYELEVNYAPLPPETNAPEYAIKIQGHNRSDDLFMFLKKYIGGLEPTRRYRVIFEIELASKYPEKSIGIGGSPGGSVFLKAGATDYEPMPEVKVVAGRNYLQMNLDKGNQSQDGADMYNLGTVGIAGESFHYQLITRGNENRPLEVTSDINGGLWLIVGTDSGFEGLTELFYNRIKVRLEQTL